MVFRVHNDGYVPGSKWKPAVVIPLVFILILVALVFSGLYYYFNVYMKRVQYPPVSSTVDKATYAGLSYREIAYGNDKATYFVPGEWRVIDQELQAHGDLITGANAYMTSYPNSLGKLTPELCTSVVEQLLPTLQAKGIYTVLKPQGAMIKKHGDFEGCFGQYGATVQNREFTVQVFFIHREEEIFMVTVQVPANSQSELNTADRILRSVAITE